MSKQELILHRNGVEEVVREVKPGDLCGEIGVLCYRPQLFTVRTKRLCQLLRLNRTNLLNLVQANVGDGAIIMNNLIEHLSEQEDPLLKSLVVDIEKMLVEGQTDFPLGLCFAAARGDVTFMERLLKRGTNPNERGIKDRTALHIAASNGNKSCVSLLLKHGADPNVADAEGNVPLWDAIMGKNPNTSLINLLVENGANLSSGDVPNYACYAIEQDNLTLVQHIIKYGGNVTLPKSSDDGITPLHAAIISRNIKMIELLLEQGADVDFYDRNGLTPRILADLQGDDEIKSLISTARKKKQTGSDESDNNSNNAVVYDKKIGSTSLKKYPSTGTLMENISLVSIPAENCVPDQHARGRANTFRNSLFGVVSAASRGEASSSNNNFPNPTMIERKFARVTVSCPGKSEASKLVKLPNTIDELLATGSEKFKCRCIKVVTLQGAEISDIQLIRDGDKLSLLCDDK